MERFDQEEGWVLLIPVAAPVAVVAGLEAGAAYVALRQASGPVLNIVTSTGVRVTGYTRHGFQMLRGIGTPRGGVSGAAWRDAIANPRSVKTGVDAAGRPFQVFVGRSARVVVNPNTGKIVSMNPLSRAGVR